MKLMYAFYKTSSLARNGIFLLVSAVVLLIAGVLFIPKFKWEQTSKQVYSMPGINLKYDDSPFVSHFLKSIKANSGYLILGTSESSSLEDGNYYDYLNADTSIKPSFSVLAGAGRTCGLYIPVFLKHKEEVKGLKIIYLVNPVYWGSNLSKVNKEYWSRYSNYGYSSSIQLSEEESFFYQPVEVYYNKLNPFEKVTYTMEYWIRGARERYFNHLTYMLNPKKYEEEISYINKGSHKLSDYPLFGQIETEKIDTTLGHVYKFHNPEWFNSIDLNEDYRYQELSTFIDLCQYLQIDATFIVGPYNERFIKHYDGGSLSPYVDVTKKLKAMLEEKNADYIDVVDISNKPGAFIDHQHHSSYGGYLLYEKIKQHLKNEETGL